MDLFFAVLIYFGCYLTGDKVFHFWSLSQPCPQEALVFKTGLGLVILSLAVTLLTFLGLIYPVSAWFLLVLPFLPQIQKLKTLAKDSSGIIKAVKWGQVFSGPPWFNWAPLSALAILIFFGLTLAQLPPTGADALVYHLAVPKAYLEHHGLVYLPNNIYAFFPMQTEMLYLLGLALSGGVLAQWIGLGQVFLLLLALAIYYRKNYGGRYAAWAPVLLFSVPTFILISASAYVDMQAAAFAFLAFYSWDLWRTRGERGWFRLMVIFTGAALATKLTMMILVPLAVLGIIFHAYDHKNMKQALQDVLYLVLGVLIIISPWWGRNWFYAGNPFAPYFMGWFGGEGGINWDTSRSLLQIAHYHSFGMGHGFWDFLALPFRLTFYSQPDGLRFDGEIGILFLLFLPGWFWLKKRDLPMILTFTALMVFWFVNFQYIRLLAPAFAFLAVLSVRGFESMLQSFSKKFGSGKSVRLVCQLVLVAGLCYNLGLAAKEWNRIHPIPYLLERETRDQYLSRRIAAFPMYQTANRETPKDAALLFIFMRNLGYLSERKFFSDTFFESHTIQSIIQKDASIDGIYSQLNSLGITHIMFDNNFVFGEDSAFTGNGREALMNFFNARTKLVQGKNGYYLYRIMLD